MGEVIFIHHPNSIFGTINICCVFIFTKTNVVGRFWFCFYRSFGASRTPFGKLQQSSKKVVEAHNKLEIVKWHLDSSWG